MKTLGTTIRLAVFAVGLIIASNVSGATLPAEVAAADSAYAKENYAEAVAGYEQALKTYGSSATLHYNLGNAYYRLDQPGRAILNYERALRINPAMDRARTNLDFVNTRIVDRPGERGTFLGNALDRGANMMASDVWAWIAFGAFIAMLAGLAVYAFVANVALRKVGFFGAGVMLIVVFVALFFAWRAASIAESSDEAIVMAKSSIMSTSPRLPKDRTEEAMLVHEGTKICILDSVKSATDSILWLDAQVDNEHRAWINSDDVERIR